MLLAGPPADPICTYFASRTTSSASFMTSSGIVAEKSSVCRAAESGSVWTMRRTSGQKPMSIMRSASSSTSVSSLSKRDGLAAHVIHQPAGRRDDDVDAGFERALLRTHVDAAVDGDAGDVGVVDEPLDVVLDLDGELAGRREDQDAGIAALFRRRGAGPQHAVQDRQQERRRLAGAGVGAADQIVAAHDDRNDRALDRRRRREKPRMRMPSMQRGLEAERVEPDRPRIVFGLRPGDLARGRAAPGSAAVARPRPAPARGPRRPRRRSRRPLLCCMGIQIVILASAEGDDAPDRIVGRNANRDAIARHHLDSEAAHPAAQLGKHLVTLVALHAI